MPIATEMTGSQNLAYIYILLTNTGTAFTRLIKCFTGAPYNHASISLDPELNELYSFGRKEARNPLNAGFVKEDVYYGTYRYFPNTTCQLLRLEVTPRQKEAVAAAIDYFKRNKERYSYNLLGLLGVLAGKDLEIQNACFCSQFVAEAMNKGGVGLWNDRPAALVTPQHFRENAKLETVFEGRLFDYSALDESKLRLAQANTYQTRTAALKVN
ncbi:hypothetical protein [Paenibacillus soyae]|uniref:Permuted papain-like amidase enzyme, YaeF/YiiX, C92 family n=1 Tax=Paenibacillus soyae TaxID=2969249 RepID=A0A9X2MP20_9BACL|nr:hypothetical protein [Paenibacillus soyae]MCR2803597.1 hypothetical protein [Paenibacillus soyae]